MKLSHELNKQLTNYCCSPMGMMKKKTILISCDNIAACSSRALRVSFELG